MSRTGNVRVAFRVRPPEGDCISTDAERSRVSVRGNDGRVHHFTCDRVFDGDARQASIYKELVAPLVIDFVSGRNCCVFAYGESGSGKTYTILGPSESEIRVVGNGVVYEGDETGDGDDFSSLGSAGVSQHQAIPGTRVNVGKMLPPSHVLSSKERRQPPQNTSYSRRKLDHNNMMQPSEGVEAQQNEISGIAPRIVEQVHDIFRRRRKRNSSLVSDDPKLSFSFVEVYEERIIDLLHEGAEDINDEDTSLSVRSSPDQGLFVEGATEIGCLHESDFSVAINSALKAREQRFDTSGCADNASHLILILKLERYSKSKGKRLTSNYFVVDLANSALVRKPPPDARLRVVRDCKSVKKSLGALRKSIRCIGLAQKTPTPSHGESVLTKVLHNGLVRGSGIVIIVTANPESQHVQESLSAIRFGTYVAGQNGEEIDDSAIKPSVVGQAWRVDSPRSPGSRRSSEVLPVTKPALLPTSRRTSEATAKCRPSYVPEVSYGEPASPDVPNKPLSQTNGHVEMGVGTSEVELTHESFSSEKGQPQLGATSKGHNAIQYGGHHAAQKLYDLQTAAGELQKLSIPSDESSQTTTSDAFKGRTSLAKHFSQSANRDYGLAQRELTPVRSGSAQSGPNSSTAQPTSQSIQSRANSAGEETDILRAELSDLRIAYDLLQQQQAAKAQELASARQEIQELKSGIRDRPNELEYSRQHDEIDLLGLDMTRTEVSNSVSTAISTAVIEDNSDDWDENRIEVLPSPVCVCLRLRPMTKLERNRRSRSCIEVHEGGREFTVDSPLDGEYDFCFDHVFDTESTQEEVYETVGAPIVDHLLGGVNCAVMVYGLAGSGKSHTLSGKLPEMLKEDHDDDSSGQDSQSSSNGTPTEQDAGFSPRLVADLFRGMKDSPNTVEYRITCSNVCIYLEKIFDLLDPRFDKTLVVRDSTNGIHIEGAVEAFCFVEEDIIHLIRRGAACRKLIGNKLAIDASRSHSILILNVEQRHIQSGRVRKSYLQLVELAGFEVTSKAKGQSLQETKIIHKSFSALGNVVKALTEGNPNAPYRESKLTSIVKGALGGNCKTTMFITASPSSYHISETINSIRLGQRMRRVTNHPRVNVDASAENYRKWLLDSEVRLNELSGFVKCMAAELVEANEKDLAVKNGFSSEIWKSILALANEEESNANPCRKALILDEDDFVEPGQQKWRALTIELAKRLPSAKLRHVMIERDRAQSIVSDIQSESVILRRQNDLLVAEKRKIEEQLASVYRENRELTLQISELTHYRQIAESRARDAVVFLRYMRTLCWKLRKDIELDRPIDISDITDCLQGAPDLTGLVDLDTMMVESGFIFKKEVEVEKVEKEYFDYLQRTGLIIDEEQAAAEEEVDELAFLDDGLGSVMSDSRWRKAQTPHVSRLDRNVDRIVSNVDEPRLSITQDTFLGLPIPWLAPKPQDRIYQNKVRAQAQEGMRHTRGERELLRDLQNMANKCVELQMELNQVRQFMDSLTNKSTTLKMKNLTQECLQLAKERDRVLHNAKAATWKLQELHVVNKLLVKQAAESKVQIGFLEEGFQRLQESFRLSVQESLQTDQSLHDRVRALQSIVDSLTGPFLEESDHDDDSDSDSDADSIGTANLLLAKIHLPLRGRQPPDPRSVPCGVVLVDPSGPQSVRRCLSYRRSCKRLKKRPSFMTHRASKVMRRSYKLGTALIGEHRVKLRRAYERGKKLVLPVFLDDDEESHYTDEEDDRTGDYTTY
ncbi:hypothetical protein MHU86_7623 [Fragilaria crotonensis]|nr:hypothetical protein MHU86_7623 [Fragilaria crotonensis]